MIYIQEARQSDQNQLAELTTQLSYATSSNQINERLAHLFTSSTDIILVAKKEDRLVGWITAQIAYRLTSDPFIEISGLVVDEQDRGEGIAKNLIKAVEDWTKQKEILNLRVRCNVVREKTHQFYQHLGFVDATSQKVFRKSIAN